MGTWFLWAVVCLSFCDGFFCQEFLFCYFERGPKTYRAFVYLEDDEKTPVFLVSAEHDWQMKMVS